MGLNLRLLSLKLRQRLNFSLLRLLLLIFYIVLTASFVIYNLPGRIGNSLAGDPGGQEEYQVQETESGDRVRDRFHAVGELQMDFRKEGAQVSINHSSTSVVKATQILSLFYF